MAEAIELSDTKYCVVHALLEPMGLRWGQPAGAESQGASGAGQYLILRNVYLNP